MIGDLGRTKIYAYCEPTDMRKGHAGLAALVREGLERDPLSGALFLFTNRRRTHAKILWFDGTGLCMYAKRLEKGRFAALWDVTAEKQVRLRRSELELFLEGSHLVGRIQVSPPNLSSLDLVPRARM
jgi:transposase